jgi:inhibitor of cysteine peptidase
LAVASTSGSLWNNSALNHFTILRETEQKLEIIGETPPYGAKEDIRSVRFVGNTAYVVTFKKTDPLFAIDVSEPQKPKILGELKIPGFSTYMHPLDKGSLIGLGFDASDDGKVAYFQGLQLSLFETHDPMNMKRKAVEILGVRGSSSAAIQDHRAFFLDKSSGVLAFPVDLRLECATWDSRCQPLAKPFLHFTGMNDFFSGAAVVQVNNSGFAEPLFISHKELLPDSCIEKGPHSNWWQNTNSEDIQRIYKIDGEMMSVSKAGLKVFRVGAGLETLQSSSWNASCVTRYQPHRID